MFIVAYASSQNNTSLSINYHHLNNAGNHGIGAGFKTNLWKKVSLVSDVGYFFQKYHGIFEKNFQKEYYDTYYAVNLNLGYNISLSKNICLLPYAGAGVFFENIDGYISSKGRPAGSGHPGSPPYHVSIDDNVSAPLANIGFLIEFYLSEHLFFTGGTKYQIDIYDGTQNNFPYLTFGAGYKF